MSDQPHFTSKELSEDATRDFAYVFSNHASTLESMNLPTWLRKAYHEIDRLRAALRSIANHPANPHGAFIHEAASIAKDALAGAYSPDEPPDDEARRIMERAIPWLTNLLTAIPSEKGASIVQSMQNYLAWTAARHFTQPPPVGPKFKVGDHVEWTNRLNNTMSGPITRVHTEARYVVKFHEHTLAEVLESELRPYSGATKPAERLCGCDAPYREGYECMNEFNKPGVKCRRLGE